MTRITSRLLLAALAGALFAAVAAAQTDPGPRNGAEAGWGQALSGLTSAQRAAFAEGLSRFVEVVSVSGTEPGAGGKGLGPRFNMNSCGGCHAQPTAGGTSPRRNPQIAVAKEYGAENSIPDFIKPDGPVRVVRFARGPGGPPGRAGQPPPPGGRGPGGRGPGGRGPGGPDGGVHDLFVVSGRKDAAGCAIAQPNFARMIAANNVFFRIPTPLYGAGLIEAISEESIMDNLRSNRALRESLGIGGHVNRSANDGTITRFGWKAQDKSLVEFAGEAMNVEEGVTNQQFPHEREDAPGCTLNPTPEDDPDGGTAGGSALFAVTTFLRFLGPPASEPTARLSASEAASIERGRQSFSAIGCAICHTPSLRTGKSEVAAMNERSVPLYSDLALHDMGPGLDDFISQGQAVGRDWRTAPLWGLGQRIFLMHDGRTTDLGQAIREHGTPGSEGYQTTARFLALSAAEKQDLFNFLRSL